MAATVHNIELDLGCTFELPVAVVDVSGERRNLAGYTGSMTVRDHPDDLDVLLTASVTIDAAAGLVTATIPAAALPADLPWNAATYDLIITNGTRTQKLVRGEVTVIQTVTR